MELFKDINNCTQALKGDKNQDVVKLNMSFTHVGMLNIQYRQLFVAYLHVGAVKCKTFCGLCCPLQVYSAKSS